jgi:hypothetical protein
VSLLQARLRIGHFSLTPGLFGLPGPPHLPAWLDQETTGPPKSPDYPFECMPRSSTPVVSCSLTLTCPGLLPSTCMTVSAFPSKRTDGYPVSTTIQISRLNHAACTLAPPDFGRLLPGLPAGFTTSLLVRLWLDGTFTRWTVLTNFINASLIPSFWI